MTRSWLVLPMFWVSGCCCSLPASADTDQWKHAVEREKNNPQIYALEAGTLNVFEVEVSYPKGWTQADEEQAAERAALREVRRLKELLVAHGADAGTLENPPAPERRSWVASSRTQFSIIHPSGAFEDSLSGGDCQPCRTEAARHHAVLLSSFGWSPLNLQTVTREQLVAGVELSGGVTVRSPGDRDGVSITAPPEGSTRMLLVESCPATVAWLNGSVRTGNGSGVIAVPQHEERSWYELRGATCGNGAVTTSQKVGPEFAPGQAKSQARIWELRTRLQQLGVAY